MNVEDTIRAALEVHHRFSGTVSTAPGEAGETILTVEFDSPRTRAETERMYWLVADRLSNECAAPVPLYVMNRPDEINGFSVALNGPATEARGDQ